MTTKIFVSQIDSTQPDGTTAAANSYIILGSNGPRWFDGALAYTGYYGSRGFDGSVGFRGSTGFSGSVGEEGFPGTEGYKGSAGLTGDTGFRGSVGFLGSVGYFGSLGFSGSGGPGFTGSVGFLGSSGYLGSVGYSGSTGYLGSVGYRGSAGESANLSFLELNDTPDTYSSRAKYVLVVNAATTGVVFSTDLEVNSINATSGYIITLATDEVTSNVEYTGEQIDFNHNKIFRPTLYGHSESLQEIGSSGSSQTIDIFDGNIISLTLNAPTVAIELSTADLIDVKLYTVSFFLKQDGSGSREVDWSLNQIWWPSAEGINQVDGPTLSTGANYTDVITLYTLDAGANWYGVLTAKGFPTP
jgi:hypothetical protein